MTESSKQQMPDFYRMHNEGFSDIHITYVKILFSYSFYFIQMGGSAIVLGFGKNTKYVLRICKYECKPILNSHSSNVFLLPIKNLNDIEDDDIKEYIRINNSIQKNFIGDFIGCFIEKCCQVYIYGGVDILMYVTSLSTKFDYYVYMDISLKILDIFEYMIKNKYVHGDLSPFNILYHDVKEKIWVIDIDTLSSSSHGQISCSKELRPYWACIPPIRTGISVSKITVRWVDAFSIGIILYYLLTGNLVIFAGANNRSPEIYTKCVKIVIDDCKTVIKSSRFANVPESNNEINNKMLDIILFLLDTKVKKGKVMPQRKNIPTEEFPSEMFFNLLKDLKKIYLNKFP